MKRLAHIFRNKTAKVLAITSIILTFSLSLPLLEPLFSKEPNRKRINVLSVVDGDTIHSSFGKVRLLGINAPEMKEPMGKKARNFLIKEIEDGESLFLEFEDSYKKRKDRYGRFLAYLFDNESVNINIELVKAGLATVYMADGLRYESFLWDAERYARRKRINLWHLSGFYGCVEISKWEYDPEGPDDFKEYVLLKNTCNKSIPMDDWYIKDEGTNILFFDKNVILEPNEYVNISCACGREEDNRTIFWCKRAVWNNKGDRLFLRDENGYLVLYSAYGNKNQ